MRTGQYVIRGILATTGVLAIAAAGASAAAATSPIKAHQHFVGVVNGAEPTASTIPVVHTFCPGPSTSGGTGRLVAGQTLGVRAAASGTGYTGVFNRIHAWFEQDVSADGPVEVTFARYGVNRAIPTAVRVPCDGTGQVTFSSCPRLAPCAAGWVPVSVTVRFVNIAA